MGLFGARKEAAPVPAEQATADAGAVEAKQDAKRQVPSKASAKPAKALSEAEKAQQQKEKEELDLAQLVAGAPDVAAQQRAHKKFVGSNTRHMYVDGLLGTAVYTFSGLQHITGQSNALTLLSMWAAGTTFLINAGLRHHLNDVTRTTMSPIATATEDAASAKSVDDDKSNSSNTKKSSTTSTSTTAEASQPQKASSVVSSTPAAASMLASAGLLVDYDTQKRNVFQLEAVASWVWMLAALQQFRVHKRLRWCGYSSWSGLACVAYYSVRYLYNVLVD